ncbi:hypothetical protein SH661x_003756 [Planctomicrobium sp. SH661]|uniref:hypothetical protein n=1 Tax=Planctomicrobium sp. SH661 TaxID=3448124 RepID=UPI003F5B0B74
MHWSALLFVALSGPSQSMDVATTAPAAAAYSSYTQAWNAAHEAERPMLVILNPGSDSDGKKITEAELRSDEKVQPLLDRYVVAVIDTTTEHGQKVNELFGAPELPRVVVIDKTQKKQIFQSSEQLSNEAMAKVLDQHKDGLITHTVSKPAVRSTITLPNYTNSSCPNCQKRYSF